MDAPKEAPAAGSVSRETNAREESVEPDHVPDPSASFLERKARMRAEAAVRPHHQSAEVRIGEYRGNTSSPSFRPLMHGRIK